MKKLSYIAIIIASAIGFGSEFAHADYHYHCESESTYVDTWTDNLADSVDISVSNHALKGEFERKNPLGKTLYGKSWNLKKTQVETNMDFENFGIEDQPGLAYFYKPRATAGEFLLYASIGETTLIGSASPCVLNISLRFPNGRFALSKTYRCTLIKSH